MLTELHKKEIEALCSFHNVPEMARAFIGRGYTPSRVNSILAMLDGDGESSWNWHDRVDMTMESGKVRAAMTDSILLRAGMELRRPAPGSGDFTTYSLKELARECLRRTHQPLGIDIRDILARAMTTTDFPYVLADAANKSLFAGYEKSEETWKVWCGVGSVPDFKPATLVRAGETDDLDEVPEHGEYNYGERSEAKETYQLATYGKLFAVTRQAIINDDLQALTDTPRAHGEAAARKIGDVAYAVLTANANMGDGNPLFDAAHNNVGTGGAVDETTIAEAIKLMRLQKDIGGTRKLNIQPKFFIAPVALEGSTMIFFSSKLIGTQTSPNLNNPYQDPYFVKIYEPRLDDDSTTAWYIAGPKGKTLTMFFLGGTQTPYLETKEGWAVDGIEYKVRIDAVAKAVDWRALVKNAGA